MAEKDLESARRALAAYGSNDTENAITDLIADLAHLADELAAGDDDLLNGADCLAQAESHFCAEQAEETEQAEEAEDPLETFYVSEYRTMAGDTGTAVDGPNGTFLVTRADKWSKEFTVWRSDSLKTICRTVDHARAVQAAITAATAERTGR